MSDHATKVTLHAIDKPNPATEIPAVARCCEAWKKTFRAAIKAGDFESFAAEKAGEAYRAAMPPLTSRETCGDFIACVAHGIAIKAIADKDGGKLLYAVQIALSAFRNERNAAKTASAKAKRKANR